MVDGDKAGAREMRRDGGQATPDGKPLETLAAMQVMGASDQHPAVEKKTVDVAQWEAWSRVKFRRLEIIQVRCTIFQICGNNAFVWHFIWLLQTIGKFWWY